MSRRRRSGPFTPATGPSLRRAASWRDSEGEMAAAVAELEALYAALPALTCKGLCQHSCDEHVKASDLEHARARAAGIDLSAPTTTGACPALVATFGAGHCAIHPVRPMVCRMRGIAASMPCPHGCLPDVAAWSAPLDGKPGAKTSDATTDAQLTDHGLGVDVVTGGEAPSRLSHPSAVGAAGLPRPDLSHEPGTGRQDARLPAPARLPDAVALRSMMAVLQLGGHDAAVPGVTELLKAYAGDELAAELMARLLRGDASVKPALGARLQQLRAPARPQTAAAAAARTPAATSPAGITSSEIR